MTASKVRFRFYEELNDFLPPERKKRDFDYAFDGKPSVKDAIETCRIPHTEVDLIIANGASVGFDYHLKDGDRIAVYPVFESIDITPIVKLRDKPLRKTRFILDVHLGTLARHLRLLGMDVKYRNDYEDEEIVREALEEHRIILTRDRLLLCRKAVTHGYFLRSTHPPEQVAEVIRRFDLVDSLQPFRYCMQCNGEIHRVDKSEIEDQLLPRTRKYYDVFYRCSQCGKVYWEGPHFEGLARQVEQFVNGDTEN
ncbi:twitching motility protein PilT [Hahella sp. CCB-MM4]|uniref:Mut7-C RNAse domain-containing protein n=1 Tax=Hahella sp. (strain CCB-MM4) TaxID=1926491 RepID=UPI000B9C706B|nr:Mut7-C RNAse domain-containing protein [Hahella sp. CCB-MM4]OZG74871.1 twitching motility protein PilT [Hahella sp. CCB-MM4]